MDFNKILYTALS